MLLSRRSFALILTTSALRPAQIEEGYEPPGLHPALLLTAKRLRLLRRERERQSPRWQQFESVVKSTERLPEPGFALALYFQVSGDQAAARRAFEWALGNDADLRQRALVYDWCAAALPAADSAKLAVLLTQALRRPAQADGVAEARSRALAAIALGSQDGALAERELRQIVVTWFRNQVATALARGRDALPRAELYPLAELLHAVRDNLLIDLRESARPFFRVLPAAELLSYYPAPYPAQENEYRVPAAKSGDFDERRAALARAAEMALVAYDNNALEMQFVQGWLMHDRFMLRSAFGAPYEFLWANPYQPGLSYYKAPLAVHDDVVGRLFVRASWDDDSPWAGFFGGQLQVFRNGTPSTVEPKAGRTIEVGGAAIASVPAAGWVSVGSGFDQVFLVGLKPGSTYTIEPEHHEMQEQRADPGGILALEFPEGFGGSVRVRETAGVPGATPH